MTAARARRLWKEAKLDPRWVRFSKQNVQRIIACHERDGDLYNFRPVRSAPHQRFTNSKEWRELRQAVLEEDGPTCRRCGADDKPQVDHIKPKSKYPDLAMERSNLQVLCWPCNKAKAAKDEG